MIKCTLIGDGSSDKMLIAPLRWLLTDLYPKVQFTIRFADLRQRSQPLRTLPQRVSEALAIYPCELLFIHRDAETATIQKREEEIKNALLGMQDVVLPACVAVVPVPMTEAWFLHNERALRVAANNPNGDRSLSLPSPSALHIISNPKMLLADLLTEACGLKGRRLRKFRPRVQMHQLAEAIEDYSPLRAQASFQHLEDQLKALSDLPMFQTEIT